MSEAHEQKKIVGAGVRIDGAYLPQVITLNVEIDQGTNIGEAAEQLCMLAQRTLCRVSAQFNSARLVAYPCSAPDDLIDYYEAAGNRFNFHLIENP